jgi:hypothetical protein|tara:strand:- start:14240 stop:14446 length:207 start_codon:yes stop_codon:yes gene_type:complete
METLLKNILCQIDRMKVLGKDVDSTSLNLLSLLLKYQTYTTAHSLTEYSDKIDKLLFQLETSCCKISK